MEISVSNPQAESLLLGVCLEGEDLSGDSQVCLPAAGSLTYKATYSPARVGHRTGRYTHTQPVEVRHGDIVGWFYLNNVYVFVMVLFGVVCVHVCVYVCICACLHVCVLA